MTAYNHFNFEGMTTYYLCGASKEDRRYAVTQKTSFSQTTLLGSRSGVMLHDGPTKGHPIIAAAGDESIPPTRYASTRYFTHGANSDILLLDPTNPNSSKVISTSMEGKVSSEGDVIFDFRLDISDEPTVPHCEFSWVEVKKGSPGFKYGGFKLMQYLGGILAQEALALLIYNERFEMTFCKEMFAFQYTDKANKLNTGGQFIRAAIISAIRLHHLRSTKRTSAAGLRFAQKIGGPK
ncbi:hypothetical protein GGR51DRAFT_552778 [Nemania sp. FL0031]|nr:hypothetical protein GGR51DRAFT_552778 [Nemania sp. FL0031]